MASIRELKKDINTWTYFLLQECFAYRRVRPGLSEDRFDEVIRSLVLLRNDLVFRTNHPENDAGATSLKAHYRAIQNELAALSEVVEQLKQEH